MKIVVAPQARDDLTMAYDYIARDNPHAADRFLVRIVEVIGMLASETLEGREVPLRDGRQVRSWPIPPYKIYYHRSKDSSDKGRWSEKSPSRTGTNAGAARDGNVLS